MAFFPRLRASVHQSSVSSRPRAGVLNDLRRKRRADTGQVAQHEFPRRPRKPTNVELRDDFVPRCFELKHGKLPLFQRFPFCENSPLLFHRGFRKTKQFRFDLVVNSTRVAFKLPREAGLAHDIIVRLLSGPFEASFENRQLFFVVHASAVVGEPTNLFVFFEELVDVTIPRPVVTKTRPRDLRLDLDSAVLTFLRRRPRLILRKGR